MKTYGGDNPSVCENCGKRPAAFRIKHAQTTRHWRCLRCMRELADDSPITITGWATTKRVRVVTVPRLVEAQAVQSMHDAVERPKPEVDAAGCIVTTDLDRAMALVKASEQEHPAVRGDVAVRLRDAGLVRLVDHQLHSTPWGVWLVAAVPESRPPCEGCGAPGHRCTLPIKDADA